jgi:hypothetical protein
VVAVLVDAARFDPSAATLRPAEVSDLERALASGGAEVRRVGSLDEVGPDLGRLAGEVKLEAPSETPR